MGQGKNNGQPSSLLMGMNPEKLLSMDRKWWSYDKLEYVFMQICWVELVFTHCLPLFSL